MSDRLQAEFDLVRRRYGGVEIGPNNGWLIIAAFPLAEGWSLTQTPLLVLVPGGYPVTPPDNFYVANELRLAGGGEPGNSSANQSHAGRMWRMFSWHIDDSWRPEHDPRRGDNLLTFLLNASARLTELN